MASEQPTGRAPYRDQHRPDRARRVRYDALRPVTRARLAAATHGEGAWCLRGEAGAPISEAAQWLLIMTLTLGLVCLLSIDSQSVASIDLSDPQGQSTRLATAALLLQALGLLVGVEVWAARKAAGRPLERGVYLLTRELVDARGHDLVLRDTEGLAAVHARGERLVLTFRDGARFSVDALGLDPDSLRQRLDERRAEALRAEADGDDELAARLDPLAAERADWVISGTSGHGRLARLARVALGSVGVPAAMLLAALTIGRAVAIERAVQKNQASALMWFAQTDRWMSGWAARRWADLAIRPGSGPAQESYLLFGPAPQRFARRLEAQTGDCAALGRQECAGTVKALCESRFHDPGALRRAVTRLDARTTRDLGPRCQRIFDRQGWTLQALSGEQFARATAGRDLEVLWAFPPAESRPTIERLYDEGRARLAERRDTPTRRALDAALVYLRERDVMLGLRVTLPEAYPSSDEVKGTQALLHHLGQPSFAPLLRLSPRPRRREEPRDLAALDADDSGFEGMLLGGPREVARLSRPRHDSARRVWDEAWLEAHLDVRTTPRHGAAVHAVRWTLATRTITAVAWGPYEIRPQMDSTWKPTSDVDADPWATTTFEAPLDPPVRWDDATSLDAGPAGLLARLL